MLETLLQALALVLLVTFLFLGDWRSTLIPAVAIPVSLIGTFAVLHFLGYSANTISLFGIILAIGVVVDDAIVVVENVQRLMQEEGLSPREATRKSMGQVQAPVIATTLVLLAVFVPVAFLPGVTGELYKQFAVTISVAVVISSLNALTLSPALCATLLRARAGPPRGFLGLVSRLIDRGRDGYGRIVERLVRRLVAGPGGFPGRGLRRLSDLRQPAHRVRAGGRSGRLHDQRAASRRGLLDPHRGGGGRGAGDPGRRSLGLPMSSP